MYSITCSVGYMLVVLLSYVSTIDLPFNVPTTVSSPYYFGYEKNYILSLDVKLKNVPRTIVTVTRYTYNKYDQGPSATKVKVNVDKKTREGEFMILEFLENHQTWFDVALHNRTGLCYTSQIIEGRNTFFKRGNYWDTTQSKAIYYDDNTKYVSNDYCLTPNVCKMVVDFSEVWKESDAQTKLPSSGSNWWIYLISIIGVTVLLLIIYLIIKRCWHKIRTNSQPSEGTEELNDNANSNQVLYAKLDFGRNGDQTANKTEESEYASIVGVVHPFGNGRS